MTKITLFSHPYYILNWDPTTKILRFDWTSLHADMSYPDFLEACSNFAGYAFEHQAKRLLIDTREFRFEMPEEYDVWRDQVHYPRFYRLGVERMSFLLPQAYLAEDQPEMPDAGGITHRNFATDAEALAWLAQE